MNSSDQYLTLGQAARESNRSKATISRAVHSGRLPAKAADDNAPGWLIRRQDLDHVFPLLAEVGGETVAKQLRTPHSGDADRNQIQRLRIEIEGLRERVQGVEQRLTDAMATIGDLRAERDQLLGMIETQAKHQPATRRKWWPWG